MNRYAVALLERGHETRAIEQLFDALVALELELVVRPRRSTRPSLDEATAARQDSS
jgi:hypothetical protein